MEQKPKENRAGCSSAPVTGYATKVEAALAWADGAQESPEMSRALEIEWDNDWTSEDEVALSTLAAEVRRLRMDVARIDWLEKNGASIEATNFQTMAAPPRAGYLVTDFSANAPFVEGSLREAIDSAMESHNDEAE